MFDTLDLDIRDFIFNEICFSAYIPNLDQVQQFYRSSPDHVLFPYWAKVWPSSIALCHVLSKHPEWITNRSVIELAAGLGLPSLLISTVANKVICSDISTDAMKIVEQSIVLNNYDNVTCAVLDWHEAHTIPDADVVLLSDVNYQAADLIALHQLIVQKLHNGSLVILTTPERIVARSFLAQLQSFQVEHQVLPIEEEYIHLYIYEER